MLFSFELCFINLSYILDHLSSIHQTAAAAPDPLIKHNVKKAAEAAACNVTREPVERLPIEDAIAKSVTPFAHLSYNEQLMKKQEAAHNILKKIGREIAKANPELVSFVKWQKMRRKGAVCEMDDIIPSPVIDGYRNKCEFTIGVNNISGVTTVGFRLSSYKDGNVGVGPIDKLNNVSDTMKTIVGNFEEYIRALDHMSYDPITHTGVWRQLTVRTTNNSDLMLIVSLHPQKMTQDELQVLKAGLIEFCEATKDQECMVTSLYCIVMAQK